MLSHQRAKLIEQVSWNGFTRASRKNDTLVTLECWKYNGVSYADREGCIRSFFMSNEPSQEDPSRINIENLEKWLRLEVSGVFYLIGLPINRNLILLETYHNVKVMSCVVLNWLISTKFPR